MLGNLHAIASGVIAMVNPPVIANVQFNQGYTTQPDGTRVPSLSTASAVQAQVQALTYSDLRQIEGLNLTGTRRAIYFFGDLEGTVRWTAQGGDLITFPGAVAGFPPGSVWLVAMSIETWGVTQPGCWGKVIATLQNGS
jgi:hypothetical protein